MRSRCRSKDGAQGPDQVSALTYRHTLQAQPGRHAHQLLGQRSGDADRVSALFGKGSDDIERAGRAIGLEVDPAHQLPIEQERPHVVAVLPFGRGCVDLDAVVEIEKPLDARTKKISGSKGHSSAVPWSARGIVRPAARYAGAPHPSTDTLSTSPASASTASAGLICPAESRK